MKQVTQRGKTTPNVPPAVLAVATGEFCDRKSPRFAIAILAPPAHFKNFLMPLFLRKGRFPGDFREGKGPIKALGEWPIKVRKRPIKEGKRPIKLNGLFSGPPPCWKTAPLKRPMKRSMAVVRKQAEYGFGEHGFKHRAR